MRMLERPKLVVLLLLIGLLAAMLIPGFFPAKEVIPWRTDFTAATAEAQRLHKPMLVDFTARWCGPCKEMARTTWSDANVAAAVQNYVPVKIDTDQHAGLALEYGIKSIPAYAVLNEKGEVVKKKTGFINGPEFLGWLKSSGNQK